MKYLIYVLYLICTTSGIIFMKLGGDSLKVSFDGGFTFKIGLLTTIGFAFYIVSFLLWQKIIVSNSVSIIVPLLTGIVQIITCVSAFIIFKEAVTTYKIIGIVLIVSGIVMLSLNFAK